MKKIMLFGAGQAGEAVLRLLYGYEPACFADNDPDKRGEISGVPVVSPDEAVRLAPEACCICVLDERRGGEMRGQLEALGYTGEVFTAAALKTFDPRLAVMRLLAEQINGLKVPGCCAELGVYRGEFASQINAAFPDRELHLFDTFSGFDGRDLAVERSEGLSAAKSGDFAASSAAVVSAALPRPERAVFHIGWFPDTFHGCEGLSFAFVSVDADLYAPTAAALPLFYDRLSRGGAIMVHDAIGRQYPGAGRAVREFCESRGILPAPVGDMHGSVIIRK